MSDLATALKIALAKKTEQEKQMQGIQTELKSTIDSWAKDDTRDDARTRLPHAFKPTNNVSRETFNAVRDNPRLQYKDIARMLANRGFNQASVGSLLTQMVNCGMLAKDDNGRYTALQAEYTPIKANMKVKPKKKAAVPATKKPNAGIAALDTQDAVANKLTVLQKPTPTAVAFDPEQLLSTLSFSQVMALYRRIKTMVGEA
jgi:hypothetical protein